MAHYKKATVATHLQKDKEKEMNLRNIQEVVLIGLSDCLIWKMRKNKESKVRINFLA